MLFSIFALAASPVSAVEWEDQSVFRVNKEEPHATKTPFATTESALSKQRLESEYALLLNGDWKFHWSPRPEERPAEFYRADFDDSEWEKIPVPSNVELQGHGVPIYTNSEYPFKRDAPRVMGEPREDWTAFKDRNPVSSYRKTFITPQDWDGRQVFVVFNGVESAFYLWCNGKQVGYSQDSRTPAEFNLTPYLKEGENTLCVEVYRFSDGSYLEDQDFWRLSGIFRDVYLWSSAPLDLRDFEVHASLDEEYEKGEFSLRTWAKHYGGEQASYRVDARVLDGAKEVAHLNINGATKADADDIAEAKVGGLDIEPWSAEEPRLYDLAIELKDESGTVVAAYARKIGFRTSEIIAGQLLVNGAPVLIKGVNRHDHHHVTGHYVSEAAMREGLDQMKRLNVNAIRTSHYPNDPRFLELCDEYGFYVVSEANIETHGYGRSGNPLPKDMSWLPAHLDRIRNNVELHKNHACAVIWSMGNEAGDGPVFAECLDWVHQRDPSRPVQYENAHVSDYRPQTPVDIFAPMYYRSRDIPRYVEDEMRKPAEDRRPLIQCEYSHAMGNSCGGLKEYWDLVRALPLYQGGFIWDWRDQGLLRTTDDGREYFAYGGDFGDRPNSNNFCMNGVVGADLTPNPHAHEVFHQYRNLLTTAGEVDSPSAVTFKVFNEHFFTDARGKPYRWSVLKNGKSVASGQGSLPSIPPQESRAITIDTGVEAEEDAEYVLTVEHLQGVDQPWAKADHVVARDQVMLPWGTPKPASHSSSMAVDLDDSDGFAIKGDRFRAEFDPTTGQLISYVWDGKEMLTGPLRLNFWRPPTDNDRGNGMPNRLGVWRHAGERVRVVDQSVRMAYSVARITYDLSVPTGESKASIEYAVHGDGVIEAYVRFTPRGDDLPRIPRIGVQCQVPRSLDQWSWYGRGPWENYRDRNSGAPLGLHSGKVSDLSRPYSETQEFGNRTGVRWASFVGDNGVGFRIESADGQPLEIGAYPYSQEDLEGERRSVDLKERDLLTLNIAHAQMGVGGEDSWGARPLPQHRLPADREYTFAFAIKPTRRDAGNATAPDTSARVAPQQDYRLVWSDEFDVNGRPNPGNWGYERGFVRNRELQWYRQENAMVEDGLLVIEARRETLDNPQHDPVARWWSARRQQAEYTSASLNTRGQHEWLYGRFEMRARIPIGEGVWPAFWTLGHGRWPACGEIDIMEYYQDDLLANAAWLGSDRRPQWDTARAPLAEIAGAESPTDWAARFHVWRMDWTPEEIRLYVDDRLLNRIDLDLTHNSNRRGDNPLKKPHYLLVNLAVGGTNGGDPASTNFPVRYEIDYVRVYQRS